MMIVLLLYSVFLKRSRDIRKKHTHETNSLPFQKQNSQGFLLLDIKAFFRNKGKNACMVEESKYSFFSSERE